MNGSNQSRNVSVSLGFLVRAFISAIVGLGIGIACVRIADARGIYADNLLGVFLVAIIMFNTIVSTENQIVIQKIHHERNKRR